MRTTAPTLMPIFRSDDQMKLLAAIYLDPNESRSVGEWAQHTGVPNSIVAREISRASNAGLVTVEHVGTSKLVSANTASPYFTALQQITIGTFGVPGLIAATLEDIPGIDGAFLFGSFAERLSGQPGSVPNDIDLLVLGTNLERDLVYDAMDTIDHLLPLGVQVTFRDTQRWAADTSGFATTVKSRPIVTVLPTHDLAPA